MLELAERLAHRAHGSSELARERRLDQPLAGLVVADDDRAAKDLDDLLPTGATLPAPGSATTLAMRSTLSAIRAPIIPRLSTIKMVDNPGASRILRPVKITNRYVSVRGRCGASGLAGRDASLRLGLLVEIHTDEGIVGVGEAPGPTLPTISDHRRGAAQFLVGQVRSAPSGSSIGWRSSRATGAIGSYAIAGIEIALLDLKGKASAVPVAELLGGLPPSRCPSSATSSSTAGGERPQGGGVRRRRLHRAEAQGRADFGQDHDTIAAIRDEVGPGLSCGSTRT